MINLRKLEKWFFYLLVFFLPWQTRAIFKFWGGGFSEWNLAAFYLTDALWLAVIFLWLIRIIRKETKINIGKLEISLFVFWAISALSLINAQNFWLGIFREIKLIEFGLLFLYLKNNLTPALSLFKERGLGEVLIASGVLQALIAIGQFVRQKSFGLSFLDESPLGPEISGVAKILVDGEKIVRSYGLTPHPNILAVFLLIAIGCALVLFIEKNRAYQWGRAVLYSAGLAFLTFAFFLTFSRVVIVIGLAAIFSWLVYSFFKSGHKWFILNTIVIFVICCLLIVFLLWPYLSSRFDIEAGLADQSFNLRAFYNQVALGFISQNPALGVGIGNFVWAFQNSQPLAESWMYQPAHNIYLLIASETGLLGLLAFLAFLFLTIRSTWKYKFDLKKSHLLFVICFLLLVGLFDHFLWDIQQGQIMFWLFLGILASFVYSPHSSACPHT